MWFIERVGSSQLYFSNTAGTQVAGIDGNAVSINSHPPMIDNVSRQAVNLEVR